MDQLLQRLKDQDLERGGVLGRHHLRINPQQSKASTEAFEYVLLVKTMTTPSLDSFALRTSCKFKTCTMHFELKHGGWPHFAA